MSDSPYPEPRFAPDAHPYIAHDQLVRVGAIKDEVLVASNTRQQGRRLVTTGVMHLPDPTNLGRPYCPWLGPVEASTLADALAMGVVGCNLCPQIKARRTRA